MYMYGIDDDDYYGTTTTAAMVMMTTQMTSSAVPQVALSGTFRNLGDGTVPATCGHIAVSTSVAWQA
jgi:hypothetical protein